ncbi:hypothetical protein J7T55_002603 [Diaporthe amygdali]|uniref:uncharacterized protein n=1 Tax=Phomopsis amygdali TaxID=1214568 RepID=UPI0022FE7CCC|nr:uncharacterized protein J7T55_002603 [Diaporthe amygdali]KAJ0122091.1 hypothetical protein J7T55_002603 [Diaporthe amygdali]
MSSATIAAGQRASSSTKRREQLIATLEALIYNDDVDLDLFQPGVPWPQARDITQQPQKPFRAPSPEERGNIQPDYQHDPAVDSAMVDAANYSQLYADPFHFFDPSPDGVTEKTPSWFSQDPEIGLESSATIISSYAAPPPPTPPQHHGHNDGLHGIAASHYGKINSPQHGGLTQYDFSKPLASPPTSQPSEVSYPSISKSSNLPLFDFMSWDMFMDYGNGVSAEANEMNNNDGTNSADDSYDDRQASVSPHMKHNQRPVQPPPEATSQVAKKRRVHHHRPGSKCASPSPPPCRRPSQASEKFCPPKGQRAHSAIEKRYRAGINEKFEALRGCIESRKRPKQESLGQALRPESKEGEGGGTTTAPERKKGAGGDAASRMNKAEVLSEATEYIQQLEDENGVMLDQLKMLVQRLRATRMALQPMTPVSSASSTV